MTEQPIVPPTPAAAAPAAPAAPVGAPPAVAPATDTAAEIARLQAQIDEWKSHSRTWEQRAKANADAAQAQQTRDQQLQEIAKALGLAPETPDPAKITAQLQAAQAEKAELARQNAVLLAAHTVGANAAALLDSRSFLTTISSVDPTDTAAVKAAVEAAVAANPLWAATPPAAAPAAQPVVPAATVPASSAGSFSGSPGAARQLTAQDVAGMSGAELSKAAKQGLLVNYFSTPN